MQPNNFSSLLKHKNFSRLAWHKKMYAFDFNYEIVSLNLDSEFSMAPPVCQVKIRIGICLDCDEGRLVNVV